MTSTHATSATLVGASAVGFSALYFLSDVIELAQGGFSTGQLLMTYVAEAAIPIFVLGLYVVQRPHIGRLGLIGAVGYAYAFVYFTGTVLIALVESSPDWSSLEGRLGVWVAVHGGLMLVSGLAFGLAVVRAGVLPRWTGQTLMVGVTLVTASAALPAVVQMISAGVRDFGLAAMGAALIRDVRAARLRSDRARGPRMRGEKVPLH